MGKSNHFFALTQKNFILWKRNPCCSLCEILLPVAICCLLFVLRASIDKVDMPETSYLAENKSTQLLSEFPVPTAEATNKTNKSSSTSNQTTTSNPVKPPPMKDCLKSANKKYDRYRNGNVYLTPKNDITLFLKTQFEYYNYTVVFNDTKQQLLEYMASEQYMEDVCLGVSFDQTTKGDYKYSLIFNASTPNAEIPSTLLPETLSYKKENPPYYKAWVQSGFLTIQNWIDNKIIQKDSGMPIKVQANIDQMKVPAYTKDDAGTFLKGNFAIYIVLPMILPFLRMCYGLLVEKEKKIREGMKIMGMSNSSFYLSWILYYMIIYTFISILISLILKIAIFNQTDFSVLFIWHWLFCWSLIFQSIFITSFFSRAKMGNIVAMLWFLFNYMINYFLLDESIPTSTKVNASISSHAGLTFSCDVFLLIETEGVGIQWDTVSREINNYNIAAYMGMTIANIFIFLILSLYADQVMPNEFGKKKHPLFFILCLFEKKSNQEQTKKLDEENQQIQLKQDQRENIEPVDHQLKLQEETQTTLNIMKLTKQYSTGKIAVQDLSMTMYNGQIFALLGHNGAGKTTTISMLTGMIDFTEGEAVAFGKNVKTQMEDIRQFMGVCPQHDILFDNLSVKEHLELFAVFKGMNSADIPEAVQKVIIDVDLQEKKNEMAKNLSGGQRRRLSVAIAFIGGSKLIYLDEPTSGMDTSARRHIWEMLKKYKNDRVVVLTTHFMDEADFLGDRIGIMGEGKLICCGSSVFLKNKYGVGYNLTVVKKDTLTDSKPIIEYVKSVIPLTHVLSNVSAEIALQLPMSEITKFSGLFLGMDEKLQTLNIQSYGISITTLEEVFLRVAELGAELNHPELQKKATLEIQSMQQMDKEGNKFDDIDNFDLNSIRIQQGFSVFIMHFIALFIKRMQYFKRDSRGFVCEIFLPCVIVVFGLSLLLIQFNFEMPPLALTSSIYSRPQPMIYSGDSVNYLKTDMDSVVSQLETADFNTEWYESQNMLDWDDYNFKKRDLERKSTYYFKNITLGKYYQYTYEVQTINRDAPPYFLNRMNTAILRQSSNNPTANIEITVNPMPLTQKILQFAKTADGTIAAFMFSIGLSFIPASLITFIVKERSDNVKHQQLVCGVSLLSYWSSNFFLDMLKHMVPAIFCILMVLAYNIETFVDETESFQAVALLFILYGWSIIPFSYLLGFVFEAYGNAQVASFFIHFLLGGVGSLIVLILRIIPKTRDYGVLVGWILRVIPSFSFGYGIVNVSSRSTYATLVGSTEPFGVYEMDIAGGDIMMMSIEGFVYYILIFVVEKLKTIPSVTQCFTHESNIPYQPKQLDVDVEQEETKINQTNPQDYTVYVKDLRKVFIPDKTRIKTAVDKVSFGIKNGECFTLLGVNGAGKTTTFKMISGEIIPTSGDAFINGYSIGSDLEQARRQIGYCPQFDALLENLTAKEHLELYAAIKGIPADKRDQLVQKKLQEMDLKKFEHICAGTYSGGNKRKLSVAIAMLGNPPIVFLDEPSTGMDPAARRFMWNVISRISTKRKQSSVILTTHSMEEAEALSTKVAIMVDGQLRCLGSVQHIKSKFGQGYEVEIKTNIPTYEEIQAFLVQNKLEKDLIINNKQELNKILTSLNSQELESSISDDGFGSALYMQYNSSTGLNIVTLVQFIMIEKKGQLIMDFIEKELGKYTLIEHFQSFYRFKIESQIAIGKVFGSFEQNKDNFNIQQYSVKQATIEQIFNMFATGKITVNQQQNQQQKQMIEEDTNKNIELEMAKQQYPFSNVLSDPEQIEIKSASKGQN